MRRYVIYISDDEKGMVKAELSLSGSGKPHIFTGPCGILEATTCLGSAIERFELDRIEKQKKLPKTRRER